MEPAPTRVSSGGSKVAMGEEWEESFFTEVKRKGEIEKWKAER